MQPLTSKLPEPTCPQGVNSKTFTPVPPNPLLTILDIYDWHHQHSSQHPFFVYPDDSSDTNTSTILWGDAVQAVYRIAHSVLASMTKIIGDERPLVGLCLTTDNLTYMLSIIGAMRTGLPVILISDCLSPATMDHIISTSGVSHIVLNEDDSRVCSLITDSISRTQQMRPDLCITTSFIPTFNDLFPGDGSKIDPPKVKPYNLDSTAFILHSSGSTAFPKLASWTYKMISVTPLWQTWYGEKDMCGHIMSTPSIPMAGAVGAMQTLLTASSGLIISGFKPTSPAIVANAENTWRTMVDTKATYGLIFQPYLCAWAQDPEKVKVLSKLDGVLFAGGPLPKIFGDKLVQAGVNLFFWFGSSESGMMNMIFQSTFDENWEYFKFHSFYNPVFGEKDQNGSAELIFKSGPLHRSTDLNIEIDGTPSYATGDLLQPHPTKPGLWKIICRVSDQETIRGSGSTEKINAVALERLLMSDRLISGAVLFSFEDGELLGLIVEVSPAYLAENRVTTDEGAASFKEKIWPTVQRYNAIVPAPAMLTKEKILLASSDKPFSYGLKGMPRRKVAIEMYTSEISRLCKA